MNESIAALMERKVWSVAMDDTVAQVESLFTQKGLVWAPVLEGGSGSTVVGVVSASDLLRFHAQGRDAATVPVWQLCSYKPISVDEATPAREVARLMVDQMIHHVVVTNREGIAGVVSSLDFVRAFIARD
jgi:predicted transcriptional regulator